MTWFKFEKAMKLLVSYFPEEPMKKPTLFHSVRVWTYLWNNWYSEYLQIAWLLHDVLEDTNMPENIISYNFWNEILEIIKANSKNIDLEKSEILEDIIKRCSIVWEDAMIVKIADIYDNFLFYVKENNIAEIERCKNLARLVKDYKKEEWDDKIFDRIDEILHYKIVRKVAFIWFYNANNQILLQERWDYSKHGEEWAFFGWWIEEWETPEQWFLREAKEELGLDMRDFDYKFIWDYIFEFPERIIHRSIFLIKTNLKETDFTVYEWVWAKYFDLEEAKKLKFPSPVDKTIEIIKKFM